MTNRNEHCWEEKRPYSAMLTCYERAAAAARERRRLLMDELRVLLERREGTRLSARMQSDLEKRIMLLRDEYDDLTDAIREIRLYAEREMH